MEKPFRSMMNSQTFDLQINAKSYARVTNRSFIQIHVNSLPNIYINSFVIDFQSVVDSFSATTEAVSILFSIIK